MGRVTLTINVHSGFWTSYILMNLHFFPSCRIHRKFSADSFLSLFIWIFNKKFVVFILFHVRTPVEKILLMLKIIAFSKDLSSTSSVISLMKNNKDSYRFSGWYLNRKTMVAWGVMDIFLCKFCGSTAACWFGRRRRSYLLYSMNFFFWFLSCLMEGGKKVTEIADLTFLQMRTDGGLTLVFLQLSTPGTRQAAVSVWQFVFRYRYIARCYILCRLVLFCI